MVAATRSRVWEEFGAPSPRKTGAAASLRGFPDQLTCTEASSNIGLAYTCAVSENSEAPEFYAKHGRKAGRRLAGKQQNPGFKHCLRKAALQDTDACSVASRAGAENDQLEKQTIGSDVGGAILMLPAIKSTTRCPKSATSPATLKFGMYAGRVKANPLKYLATVLRSKLQPHYAAFNLLQVATEIHDEAKNKHNTTLRRIYDVVNVLEAAGLLERSNGSTPKRLSRNQGRNECSSTSDIVLTGSPSAECSNSAVEFGVSLKKCYDEQIDICSRDRTTVPAKKQNQLDKKSTRGSRIRWLEPGSENEQRSQKIGRLTQEKIAAVQRISDKQREFEILQEELRLTAELINYNQSRIYQYDRFESNIHPCTPPPEDLSCSYLNFEDCSQTSAETERSFEPLDLGQTVFAATVAANDESTMCGSSSSLWSSTKQELNPVLNRLSIVTEADGCYDFSPLGYQTEVGLNILEAAEQYQSNSLPLTSSGTTRRGLHVPFVILQTSNSTNVDIDLASSETTKVSIVLDDEYKLFDYRELLSAMFPAQDCDGGLS